MCKKECGMCRKEQWSEYVSKENKKISQMNKTKKEVIHRYKHASNVMQFSHMKLVITQTINLKKMCKNCSKKT